MACILKTGETYTYKGINVPSPYLVIDKIQGYNKHEKTIVFSWYIYPSQADRDDTNMILEAGTLSVGGESFNALFTPAKIQPQGIDPFKKAYEHLLTVTNEEGTALFSKWKGDEA